jgi:hypothetical protein
MAMNCKNGKSFSTIVSSVVKKYFHGKYTTDVSVFAELSTQLEGVVLSKDDRYYLSRILRLFFLGQLVGLHSLHAILTRFGILSSREQTSYKSICEKLSNKVVHQIFNFFFEAEIRKILVEKVGKHGSSWSRELVTAVIDDSIFKQWQTSADPEKDYEYCYAKFFSGQVKQAVWGYQVVTFGLSIDGVFYPMFLECAPKATDENKANKEKPSHLMAVQFITKWGAFVKKLAKEGCNLPNILFSCDSGYSSIVLSDACQEHGLVYISVPGKKHLIEYEGKHMSISAWTTSVFEVAEKVHIEKEQALPDTEKTAFTLRFRAGYKSQNRELTFLAFRLKGSNKISVIYTTDKNIKGKTLRRHWFQRTYIEQFFRLLKHTMCIQLSITTTKHAFEVKVLRFAFVGLHMQLIVKTVRKATKAFRKKGIGTLRAFCQSNMEIIGMLEEILKTPFAKK